MEFEAQMIGSLNFSRYFYRVLFLQSISLVLVLLLSCTISSLDSCAPSTLNNIQPPVGHNGDDDHDFLNDSYDLGCSSNYHGRFVSELNIENVCTDLHLFCFPSTLPGFSSIKHRYQSDVLSPQSCRRISNSSFSSDCGILKSFYGKLVFCSLESGESIHYMSSICARNVSENHVSSYVGPVSNEGPQNGSSRMISLSSDNGDSDSSSGVEITPPILDWGQRSLYVASPAYLTVSNHQLDSVLHIYERFSTNLQFYSCNDSEFSLHPGESTSICFVFLPNLLGPSLGFLILQTNSGGFLVEAKGFGIKSLYLLQPLIGLDFSSEGRLSRNLSVFNPYNETLHVKEVSIWMDVSFGNTPRSIGARCDIHDLHSFDECEFVGTGLNFQRLFLRPHGNWDIDPSSSEIVVEIEFFIGSVGKVIGVFSMQLLSSSGDKADRIMMPIEAKLGGKKTVANVPFSESVSVLIEALVPCDSNEAVFSISLRSPAFNLLSVLSVFEVSKSRKLFKIRSMDGLILFPKTITRVAIATSDFQSVFGSIDDTCGIYVVTNDSFIPQIEIPCRNVVQSCIKHGHNLYGEKNAALTSHSGVGIQWPSNSEVLEMGLADEMVLENWKSHGIGISMSVLEDQEISFPMVYIGTNHSKWVTVRNPSHLPIAMQLILNSAEVIKDCRDNRHQSSSPKKYNGFSVTESSIREVFVHPFSSADIGPISFNPSDRCNWTSSALIRNNLSGVEWLGLKGSGGLHSLSVFENSEPIKMVEFNFTIWDREDRRSCSRPLKKQLSVKNTGDMRVEVKKFGIFDIQKEAMIQDFGGFRIKQGESVDISIQYLPDWVTATLNRDLELSFDLDVPVRDHIIVPMKAVHPQELLDLCGREGESFFLKLSPFLILIAGLMGFLMFCFLISHIVALPSPPSSAKITRMEDSSSNIRIIDSTPKARALDSSPKHSSSSPKTRTMDRSDEVLEESSNSGKLMVKITKERKRRRRRKRQGSAVGGSQSGNSTPSSPLSPPLSTTDEKSDPRNPFSKAPEPEPDLRRAREPDVHVSAEIRSACAVKSTATPPLSGSGSSSAPVKTASVRSSYVRAPGPAFGNGTGIGTGKGFVAIGKEGDGEKKFRYDIWGDHLSGLHLGKEREVSAMAGNNGEEESFFVKGPRGFETRLRSVSYYFQEA